MHKHVKRIDFEIGLSNSDGERIKGTENKVSVLFNDTVINQEEVMELIQNGMYEYDQRIILTTPKAADALKGVFNK